MGLFELIRTILVSVGFPCIVSAAVSILKLWQNYLLLIKRVDELEKIVAEQPSGTDHTILVNSISSIEKSIDKMSEVLEVISKTTLKHDVVLDSIQGKMFELKDEMRTRPCVAHAK